MVSVTKLLNLLNKSALLKWANSIGLKGIDINEYQSNVKIDGVKKHNNVERYLKYGELFEGYEKLKQNFINYEVIGIEKDVDNGFLIGRIDLILKKNNEIIVCDFKRNSKIYLGTKIQLSAYKNLINADKIAYINFDNYEIVYLDIETNKYYEIIKRLYQIHILLLELKEKL